MADERRNKRDKVQRNKNGDIEKKHSNIKNRKKSKKKKRTITVIISVIIAFVLLAMLGVCVVFQHFYGMMNISDGRFGNNTVGTVVSPNTDTNTDDPNSSEDRDTLAYSDNVYNILLLGSDSRSGSINGLSDVMLLVSINRETKQLIMSSFLRDIYVEIPGHGYEKLNAANAFGGPALAIETIEENFNIDINSYAAIDFISFVKVVDTLGGVDDIELSESEVYYINHYLSEINQLMGTSSSTDAIYDGAGTYHLTGRQALAYCRNRYSDNDFGRTGRQREVLGKLWEKIKTASITDLYSIARDVLPNVTTDLSQSDCLSLLMTVAKVKDYELVSQHIPAEGTYTFEMISGMDVVSIDFDENKKILHDTVYGE